VPRVERVERGLAVVQEEQGHPGQAQDEVGRPHRHQRVHEAVVTRLLAQPDQHVIDEDDADGEAEGGGARFLLAAQRQPQPEQAEDETGGRDGELLVPLHLVASGLRPGLALRAQVAHPLAQLAHGQLAVALGQGQLGKELLVGEGEVSGLEVIGPDLAGLGDLEGVGDPVLEVEPDPLPLLVDGELAAAG
jgi:hypothetical protein